MYSDVKWMKDLVKCIYLYLHAYFDTFMRGMTFDVVIFMRMWQYIWNVQSLFLFKRNHIFSFASVSSHFARHSDMKWNGLSYGKRSYPSTSLC